MAKMVNTDLAEKVTGRASPHSFPVLDASILEMADANKILREDVKLNRVRFEFPSGFNKLSLFEECRALTLLNDFEAMYDITMQMLVDKDLIIKMRNNAGGFTTLCEAHVADKFQNLRGYEAIDEYPILITWLVDFISEYLSKKYPQPGNEASPTEAAKMSKKIKNGDGLKTSVKQK